MKRKRIVLFTYAFPPSRAVGAKRALYMAKYLIKYGWDVTIITPKIIDDKLKNCKKNYGRRNLKVVYWGIRKLDFKFPEKLINKLLSLLGLSPDEIWALSITGITKRINLQNYDIIMVTCSPFILSFLLSLITKKIKKSLVIDYRDPWSINHLIKYPVLIRKIMFMLERKTLRECKMCFTVSTFLKKLQEGSFKINKCKVITNGYDPEEIQLAMENSLLDIKLDKKKFHILYAGSFYSGQREIDPALRALLKANIVLENSPFILHYVGTYTKYMKTKVEKYKAHDFVKIHGWKPRFDVYKFIRMANLALVIISTRKRNDLYERGITSAKLFDILGLGAPIWMIAPHDSEAEFILDKYGAGKSFQFDEIDKMVEWLIALYKGKEKIQYSSPQFYSWEEIGKKLDRYLVSLIS